MDGYRYPERPANAMVCRVRRHSCAQPIGERSFIMKLEHVTQYSGGGWLPMSSCESPVRELWLVARHSGIIALPGIIGGLPRGFLARSKIHDLWPAPIAQSSI